MTEESQSRTPRLKRRKSRTLRFKNVIAVVLFLTAGAGVAFILSMNKSAGDASQTSFDQMRSVPVLEMPASAVQIVGRTDALGRPEVIRDVLRSISVSARPGIMPYAVGGLLRSYSEDYQTTLQSAVELCPAEVVDVAGVAAQSCPDHAEDITFILSRGAPDYCVPVAVAVWKQTKGMEYDILRGLTNGVPRLAPSVDASTRFFGVTNFDFVLNNALDRLIVP